MTKEEFTQKLNELNSTIDKAKIEIELLKKNYIEANKKYDVGQVVTIITPEHTATVLPYLNKVTVPEKRRKAKIVGYQVCSDGEILPVLHKIKKDGNESKIMDYLSSIDVIQAE